MPYYSHLTNTIEPNPHHMRQVNLDTLLNAYIDCALWSSINSDEESPHYGSDFDNFTLSDRFKQTMRDRLAKTLSKLETRRLFRLAVCRPLGYKNTIDAYTKHTWTYDDDQFGHDLWLTENGHGAGFWDRDELDFNLSDSPVGDSLQTVGDMLTELVKYREGYLYLDNNENVCMD